jgi:hypothetical protein
MRSILGLCVVLAVASPAWTTEVMNGSLENAAQIPAPVSPTVPSSSLPAVTMPSITNQPQVPTQAAPTTAAPVQVMTNSGSTVVGAQPGTMTTSTTGVPMTYYYPMGTTGSMYRMTTPVYSGAPVYTTSGYSMPAQAYYPAPQQQMFYQPVRQRRGLFGMFQPRWGQQAVPAYTNSGYYPMSGYGNASYVAPGYTNVGYISPPYPTTAYTPTTYYYYYTPSGNNPASMAPGGMVSSGAAPAATTPAYTPTTLTVPSGSSPIGTTSATRAAPAAAAPTATIPSVVTPAAPAVKLPGNMPQ